MPTGPGLAHEARLAHTHRPVARLERLHVDKTHRRQAGDVAAGRPQRLWRRRGPGSALIASRSTIGVSAAPSESNNSS